MLKGYYLLQMECVYRNGRPMKGAQELLNAFYDNHIPYVLMSEQSASAPESIAEKMRAAGLKHIRPHNIFTGAYGACSYLHWRYPEKNKIYTSGGKGLRDALDTFHLKFDRSNHDFVLMGMNRDMTYADYNEILHMILYGAELVSVDNRILQQKEGESDLGNGAVVKMLEYASGTRALSFGRGSERMMRACARYMEISPSDFYVVGNDFRKDLMPAVDLGAVTFLVSEGQDIMKNGVSEDLHPDYIVEDLSGIAK